MLKELRSREKVIGVKQSRRAIREGRARQVFLACDADPALAGIQVGAAVVVLLEDR